MKSMYAKLALCVFSALVIQVGSTAEATEAKVIKPHASSIGNKKGIRNVTWTVRKSKVAPSFMASAKQGKLGGVVASPMAQGGGCGLEESGTSDPSCDTPQWTITDFIFEFFDNFSNSYSSAEVTLAQQAGEPVVIEGKLICNVAVSTPYGKITATCDELEALDLEVIGIDDNSRDELGSYIGDVMLKGLDEIANEQAKKFKTPCVKSGEQRGVYNTRTQNGCVKEVVDALVKEYGFNSGIATTGARTACGPRVMDIMALFDEEAIPKCD